MFQRGETISGIHSRANEFLILLVRFVDRHHPEAATVLLVSHTATAISLGRALSGDPEKGIRAGTSSLSQYRRSTGLKGAGWKMA